MAEGKKTTAKSGGGQKIRITLDDSNLETQYANFANVTGSREEIMVDFGLSNVRRGEQPSVSVKVSRRLVLNPYTAKRLALMMNQAISRYEAAFGPIEIGRTPDVPDISPSHEEVSKPN